MSVETFIGWRYLRSKRRQKFISVISLISLSGVALGVMALIVVLAVMSGFREDLQKKILGVNSHIVILGDHRPLNDYDAVLSKIETNPSVSEAEAFIYNQVMISGLGAVSGAVLRGIDPKKPGQRDYLKKILVAGSPDGLDDPSPEEKDKRYPGVLIGQELAHNIGVITGDTIRVIAPLGRITPLGGRAPSVKNFLVTGIFKSGMYEFDSTLVYISLSQAQEFLNLGHSVTGIELKIKDVYKADKVKQQVLASLGPGYKGKDWKEMNQSLFSALQLEKVAMFVIMTMTVLVAAFNIVTTLIMMVMDKAKDIAILKSMGATSRMVMKVFIFQGLFIGVLGTLVGLMGGVGLCQILDRYEIVKLPETIYYVPTIPVRMNISDVAAIVCSAILISFLATIYPAWQASRLNPVEALRYE